MSNLLANLSETARDAWDSLAFRVVIVAATVAALPVAFLSVVAGSLS